LAVSISSLDTTVPLPSCSIIKMIKLNLLPPVSGGHLHCCTMASWLPTPLHSGSHSRFQCLLSEAETSHPHSACICNSWVGL
jgi:hypothetical protein